MPSAELLARVRASITAHAADVDPDEHAHRIAVEIERAQSVARAPRRDEGLVNDLMRRLPGGPG